jgi:hypothetical protein
MGDAVTFTVWQQDAETYGVPEPTTEAGLDTHDPTGVFEQGPVPSARGWRLTRSRHDPVAG